MGKREWCSGDRRRRRDPRSGAGMGGQESLPESCSADVERRRRTTGIPKPVNRFVIAGVVSLMTAGAVSYPVLGSLG